MEKGEEQWRSLREVCESSVNFSKILWNVSKIFFRVLPKLLQGFCVTFSTLFEILTDYLQFPKVCCCDLFVSFLGCFFFSVFCNILKHSPKTLWQFFKLLGDPLMLIQHLLAIFQNLLAIFGHPFRWFYRDSPKWDECFNSINGQIFLNMSESLSFEKCLQWKLWKIVFVCLFVVAV